MHFLEQRMSFACRLSSRALIRVSGVEAHEFLQGLFTNDLRSLHPGGSMWGCFLHHTGRVLADAYLYQSSRVHNGQSSILVDVHRDVAESVEEHLREMRMRKKAQIDKVSPGLVVFASTNESGPPVNSAHVESFPDPRSFAFPSPLRKTIVPEGFAPASSDSPALYNAFLCASGIGEGPGVFRPSKTLPFEANTDFLGGVSFKKGCYLGQELTHRTHVMLVTRKRTVPLRFPSLSRSVEIGEGLLINGQKVGNVLDVSGDVGLGLVRLHYVDAEKRVAPGLALHDATPVEMAIPNWWPEAEVKKMLSKQ